MATKTPLWTTPLMLKVNMQRQPQLGRSVILA